jgi:hypothetical protein
MKYTDPTGNYAIIDDIIAAFLGGSINVLSNLKNIHSFGQGVSYFGIGAGGGVASLYVSPVVGAGMVGAANTALTSYNQTGQINWGQVGMSAFTSAAMGSLTMGIGNAVGSSLGSAFSGIASPAIRGALTQGTVGAALGGITNWATGGNVLEGAAWGLGIGLTTGLTSGIRSAYRDNINPWSGADNNQTTVYRAFGGDSRAEGYSWTPEDPTKVNDYRNLAGLPSGGESGVNNTAEFMIEGKVNINDIIEAHPATPLDGNIGGLREYIIDPKNVIIINMSVLKP